MVHKDSTVPKAFAGLYTRAIAQIRANVKGQVITPQDDNYDTVRLGLSKEVVSRPVLIVRPVDAYDVSYVVSLAREAGVELAIRGGGHSLAGFSTSEGGFVLDMSQLKGLEIDTEEQTAWAQPGLTAGEYTLETSKYGLVTGFGDTATVGIGGLTTGGGIGYLVRKFGLTIDNLLAVEIVTADGEIRYADAHNNSDLFWAIRGGGSNFGVVTHFKYRLHEVNNIIGGMLILPATAPVISKFISLAWDAPNELSTILSIMPAPPMPFIPEANYGQVVALAMMVYVGDHKEGLRAVEPFRKLAEPIVDMIGPMPYHDIYWPDDPEFHPVTALQSKFIDRVDERTAQIVLSHLETSDAPIRIAEFRVLGGAMAHVPVEATAFAHRLSRIMASFIIQYEDHKETTVHNTWVINGSKALNQGTGAAYVNFIGREDRLKDAYPFATQERLAIVKAKYDPTNLFRRNHNIKP